MRLRDFLRRLFRKPPKRTPWVRYHRSGNVRVHTLHPAWIAHVEKVSKRLSEPQSPTQEGEK